MQPYREAVDQVASSRKIERFEAKRGRLKRRIRVAGVRGRAAAQEAGEPQTMKINRDAFLYLAPKPPEASFAQCNTCRDWVSVIHGPKITGTASCGFNVHGDPQRCGTKTFIDVTPEESGLVDRQARCENCKYGGEHCELYKMQPCALIHEPKTAAGILACGHALCLLGQPLDICERAKIRKDWRHAKPFGPEDRRFVCRG
jgi:hypothetical protein